MQEKDYKVILEQMPSEVRMKLEQIKMFLTQGKASVMVGAGFSKNAQQLEFAEMKDWGQLTKLFYDQLFIGEKNPPEKLLHESLKLAQMYECSFGRNALDELIQNSLPDDTAIPGKLHYDLMRLNWRDVFTTNYDRLLESAASTTDRGYQVVTNKETLLYANSPRIVKLHGSFPNIRPYIITEEDFRTYPQKYPEFVNTVRQALMESLFCLIGFSGDDPNFLQWIGWLRDVMSNQASPTYLITYETHLHKSQVDLFKGRGIEIINMANIANGISYSEGLEFVMKFLSEKNTKKWNPRIELGRVEKKEDFLKATERLRKIREEYPHYLYLLKEYHFDFDEIDLFRFGIKKAILDELSMSQKIQFVYEVVWRYEVSMTPIRDSWLLEIMESLTFDSSEVDAKDNYPLNEIRLSLLTLLRIFGLSEDHAQLVEILRKQSLSKEQKHRLEYERCLYYLEMLDYGKVKEILKQWEVEGNDLKGTLWKSVLLSEVGRDNDAINLLNSANLRLRQTMLTQRVDRQIMQTYTNALDEVLKLLESQSIVDTALVDLKNYIIRKLADAESKPSRSYETVHQFAVDQEQNTWHSGTNQEKRLMYAYKFLRLTESVGYPFGHMKFTVNESWLKSVIPAMLPEYGGYAIRVLVRSRSRSVTISSFNRTNVYKIPSDLADRLYTIYQSKFQQYIESLTYGALERKVSDVLFPLFARLAPKLSLQNVYDLACQYLSCYNKHKIGYDSASMQTIMGCMCAEDRMRFNSQLFSAIPETMTEQIPWSALWIEHTSVRDEDINEMASKLVSDKKIDDSRLYIRLWYMLYSDLNYDQRDKLERAVREWRNKEQPEKAMRHIIDTFKQVPYQDGTDIHKAAEYIAQVVGRLERLNVDTIKSSGVMQDMSMIYTMLTYFAPQLDSRQQEIMLSKMYDLLESNKELLKEDDSMQFMGGMRGALNRLIVQFTKYIAKAELKDVNNGMLQNLQEICLEYIRYGVPTIAIVVRLNNYTKSVTDIALLKYTKESILQGEYITYAEGLHAVLLTNNYVLRQRMISRLIDYASYAVNKRTKHFVDTITKLILDENMNVKTWKNKVNDLLNRVADLVNAYEGDEDQMDLMFYTNILAGAVYAKWGETSGSQRWKEITKRQVVFNDVRVGFDIGQANVFDGKETLMNSLVLRDDHTDNL